MTKSRAGGGAQGPRLSGYAVRFRPQRRTAWRPSGELHVEFGQVDVDTILVVWYPQRGRPNAAQPGTLLAAKLKASMRLSAPVCGGLLALVYPRLRRTRRRAGRLRPEIPLTPAKPIPRYLSRSHWDDASCAWAAMTTLADRRSGRKRTPALNPSGCTEVTSRT